MKKENASIALFVLTSVIVIVIAMVGIFTNLKNKQMAQEKENDRIVEQYEKELNQIDEIYDEKTQNMEGNNAN